MNSLDALIADGLRQSQNMLAAGEVALAQLNSQFANPFTAPGGFAASQVAFNNAFNNALFQASFAVAAQLPDNVVPFTPAQQSAAISGAFNQGTVFVNDLMVNANRLGNVNGAVASQIGGVVSVATPDGTLVGDVSSAAAFNFLDPISGQIIQSNTPIDANAFGLVPLQPAFI